MPSSLVLTIMQQQFHRKPVSVADLMRRDPSLAEAALILPRAEPPRPAA